MLFARRFRSNSKSLCIYLIIKLLVLYGNTCCFPALSGSFTRKPEKVAFLTSSSTTLSELLKPYLRYVMSGEINTKVEDVKAVIARIKETAIAQGSQLDELDGLTVSGEGWWFNVRPSNTEPLLRLNVEAKDVAYMEIVRDSVLAMMVG